MYKGFKEFKGYKEYSFSLSSKLTDLGLKPLYTP